MKISWTPTALATYFKVCDYIEQEFDNKSTNDFITKTNKVLELIAKEPLMFEASKTKKNVRKGFVTEQTSLFYRIRKRKEEIEILTFWDNRQDPAKLKY